MTVLFDVPTLTYVVAVLLPLLVGVVTSKEASQAWGAWVLAILNGLLAVGAVWLTAAQNNVPVHLTDALPLFLTTFTMSVASHYGFFKNVGVTGSNGAIQTALPGGLGGPPAITAAPAPAPVVVAGPVPVDPNPVDSAPVDPNLPGA